MPLYHWVSGINMYLFHYIAWKLRFTCTLDAHLNFQTFVKQKVGVSISFGNVLIQNTQVPFMVLWGRQFIESRYHLCWGNHGQCTRWIKEFSFKKLLYKQNQAGIVFMLPKIKRNPRISSTCVLWLNPLNAHFRKEEWIHVQKKQKMLVNVFNFETSMDLLYKIISNMLNLIYMA